MLDYSTFPTPHMVNGLKMYIEHKIPPGSFMLAVLENDLKEACGRADDMNRHRLFEIVQWLYNEFPIDAWGSPERVMAWLKPCDPLADLS